MALVQNIAVFIFARSLENLENINLQGINDQIIKIKIVPLYPNYIKVSL